MMRFSISARRLSSAGIAALAILAGPVAMACTRLVYLGEDGMTITARSMDWKTDVGTNLWILPRGMARSGQAGPNSIKWTSKYGSVIATGYDVSTTDGANEAGLVPTCSGSSNRNIRLRTSRSRA